jgi:hypothetical protein
MKLDIGLHECCEVLRANNIKVTEQNFTAMVQAGEFPEWAVPSVDTKQASPLLSRAGFVKWVKAFYHIEEVRGI